MFAQPQAILGLVFICVLAWLVSERRDAAPFRLVIICLGLQFFLAFLLTKTIGSEFLFVAVDSVVRTLNDATRAGTTFVFGYIGGAESPFVVDESASTFVLAFQALPLIIVLSALTSLLNYWRILPAIIDTLAKGLQTVTPISSATAFACVANLFMGMVESPLFIKSYLTRLSRSDLFILMTVGMATIAGTVMVIYVGFLNPVLPNAAGHLLTASIISIPAAIAIACIMVPSTEENVNEQRVEQANGPIVFSESNSAVDAIVHGTQQGLQLCLAIAALLLVFVALVALLNAIIAAVFPSVNGAALSLQSMVGYLMTPVAWLIGIPWEEAHYAGELLGIKLILNEFIALSELGAAVDGFSERSTLVLSYALSGFANIGSLGILIGGLSTMAPTRRMEIIELAPRAVISGTLATLMTGTIIALLH